MSLLDKVFGSHSDKEIKRISKTVDKIEALDEEMQKLSDEELKHKTRIQRASGDGREIWMICFLRLLLLFVRPAAERLE